MTEENKYQYHISVFVGRFQPFHNGHYAVVRRALEISERLILLIGSSNRSRSMRNPFTYAERSEMIRKCLTKEELSRVTILDLEDFVYNDTAWVTNVQSKVRLTILNLVNSHSTNVHLNGLDDARVCLIGCAKDNTSYYLKLFPTWSSENVDFYKQLSATDIREDYFNGGTMYQNCCPERVMRFMQDWKSWRAFEELVENQKFIDAYRVNVHKYPRIEHTVDAVVIQSGHVLLVKRKENPGRGQWALPGGFIHPDETLEDAMIRELREETRIKVPAAVLRGNIKVSRTFDDPNRSSRGRVITQAYLIKLADDVNLPKVRGSDDAEKAKWVPIADLQPEKLFEDHYFILQHLLGEVP